MIRDLDPPTADEPAPIPITWTTTDPYSGATLTIESDGQGTCRIRITYDNDGMVTVGLTVDVTDAEVHDLGRVLVIPVMERTAQEAAAERLRTIERAERRRAEELLQPFTLVTKGAEGGTLHRRGCRVLTGSMVRGLQRSEHTDRTIDAVRIVLGKIVTEPRIITQRAHRLSGYARPRIVPTLKFCATCKPLGEASAAISAQLADLANTSAADGTEAIRLEAVTGRIEALIWEVSREHIDGVEGR